MSIGALGLEPRTSCSQSRRSSHLSYAPLLTTPKTGQPDFATLEIDYVPDQLCVELKALKLYIWSYRDKGAFHEAVSNKILDDLVNATTPRFMRITAKFNVRGGIVTHIVTEHRMDGWEAAVPVALP